MPRHLFQLALFNKKTTGEPKSEREGKFSPLVIRTPRRGGVSESTVQTNVE